VSNHDQVADAHRASMFHRGRVGIIIQGHGSPSKMLDYGSREYYEWARCVPRMLYDPAPVPSPGSPTTSSPSRGGRPIDFCNGSSPRSPKASELWRCSSPPRPATSRGGPTPASTRSPGSPLGSSRRSGAALQRPRSWPTGPSPRSSIPTRRRRSSPTS